MDREFIVILDKSIYSTRTNIDSHKASVNFIIFAPKIFEFFLIMLLPLLSRVQTGFT